MQDSLTPSHVQETLETIWLGRIYRYFPAVSSTNDLLKEQEKRGDLSLNPTGTVLLTDYQKRGRGRMARSWEAPSGSSLLFSILLRPSWPVERLSWLTMISGLAVSEAVEQQTGKKAHLKWPNDCVVSHDDVWQKYCGILLEAGLSENNSVEYAVIGIGVNVNIPEEQLPSASFPATSLSVANGRALSRLQLFSSILSRFERHYDLAEGGHSPHAAWQERLIFLNKRVAVSRHGQGAYLTGLAIGTDATGHLIVRDDSGDIHHIAAGDLTLREYLEP